MVVMFNVVGELQACMLLPSVLGELLTLKPALIILRKFYWLATEWTATNLPHRLMILKATRWTLYIW